MWWRLVMATIGFIVDDMFEDRELRIPLDRASAAGHDTLIIGVDTRRKLHGRRGKLTLHAQAAADDVDAGDLDALVIPGGYSPDRLRENHAIVALVREMHRSGRPVAAICHAGSLLVEADIAEGRTVTSWPSIK